MIAKDAFAWCIRNGHDNICGKLEVAEVAQVLRRTSDPFANRLLVGSYGISSIYT
jgi:hypothetical protein